MNTKIYFIVSLFCLYTISLMAMESTPQDTDQKEIAQYIDSETENTIQSFIQQDRQNNRSVKEKNNFITGKEGKDEESKNIDKSLQYNISKSVQYNIIHSLPPDMQNQIAQHIINDLPIKKVMEAKLQEVTFPHLTSKNITKEELVKLTATEDLRQQNRYHINKNVTITLNEEQFISYTPGGNSITLYQTNKRNESTTIAAFNIPSIDCVVIYNNRYMVVAHACYSLAFFDLSNREHVSQSVTTIATQQISPGAIMAIATTNDLLIAGAGNSIIIWNLPELIKQKTDPLCILNNNCTVFVLAVHKNLLFTNTKNSKMNIWDLNKLPENKQPIAHITVGWGIETIIANKKAINVLHDDDKQDIFDITPYFNRTNNATLLNNFFEKHITFLHALLLLKVNTALEQKNKITLSPLFQRILKDLQTRLTINCNNEVAETMSNLLAEHITQDNVHFTLKPITFDHIPILLAWAKDAEHKIKIPLLRNCFISSKIESVDNNWEALIPRIRSEKANIIYANNRICGYLQTFKVMELAKKNNDLDGYLEICLQELDPKAIFIDFIFTDENVVKEEHDTTFLLQFMKEFSAQNPEISSFIIAAKKTDYEKIQQYKKIGFEEAEINPDLKHMLENDILLCRKKD